MNIIYELAKDIRMNRTLTSASRLEVGTAVAELKTRVIAVAWFVRGVLNDGVDWSLLDDACRITAGTTELGLQTTARVRGGHGQQNDGDAKRDDRGGATSHRVQNIA